MDKTQVALAIAALAAAGGVAPAAQAEEPLTLSAEQMDAVTAGARAAIRVNDLDFSAEAEGDYAFVSGSLFVYAYGD